MEPMSMAMLASSAMPMVMEGIGPALSQIGGPAISQAVGPSFPTPGGGSWDMIKGMLGKGMGGLETALESPLGQLGLGAMGEAIGYQRKPSGQEQLAEQRARTEKVKRRMLQTQVAPQTELGSVIMRNELLKYLPQDQRGIATGMNDLLNLLNLASWGKGIGKGFSKL